ncbi:MAG: hypothetical protein WA652_13420, partial [Xanthobacteraceae bacterium]
YFSKMQSPIGGDKAKIAQAESGLRGIFERFAKQKLPAHRKTVVQPGLWGSYTLRFTPPYTGAGTLGTYSVGQMTPISGNPIISASGVDNLGQMSCSVTTSYDGPNSGMASNVLGISFKPAFALAAVSISFDSEISFSWAVNSIHGEVSDSSAQGFIELYRYDGAFFLERIGSWMGWDIIGDSFNPLDFDVFTGPGPTWSLEGQVSSENFYFVVIRLSCSASGQGWPGSLATTSAMITVPSITVTLSSIPIITK